LGTIGAGVARQRLHPAVARPALFHRADWVGTSLATAQPEGPRVHAAAIQSDRLVRAREFAALAGTFGPRRHGRTFAGYGTGIEDPRRKRRAFFPGDRASNAALAVARRASVGR